MTTSSLTLLVLGLSVVLQTLAAVLALTGLQHSGRYRYPWIALALALLLMVERRAVPLIEQWRGAETDLLNAVFGLLISLMMVIALLGLRRLLSALHRAREELRLLATTDSLTGVVNRRQLLQELDGEIQRARRSARPLSVLMLDLDHFKAVNDTYGHGVGDEVLVKATARCREQLRTIDILGRVGGEEFVAVLPEADADEAIVVAERLRHCLSASAIATNAGALQVTVSIGAVTLLPAANTDDSRAAIPEALTKVLLDKADAALYQAKQGGRNCVRHSSE